MAAAGENSVSTYPIHCPDASNGCAIHRLQHEYFVNQAPPSLYYIPDFITEEEENYLIRQVDGAPKPKWTQLSNRRLQNWGGFPDERGMVPEKLPQWLDVYCKKIGKLDLFEGKVPNHVLVNDYQPGQGIMPHEDGPLYYPTVTTISLGSHTMLDFYHHRKNIERKEESVGDRDNVPIQDNEHYREPFLSMLLEPRSLFVARDDMYKVHLHGIAERTSDVVNEKVANFDSNRMTFGEEIQRTRRISLTIRYVPKVLKAKLIFRRH